MSYGTSYDNSGSGYHFPGNPLAAQPEDVTSRIEAGKTFVLNIVTEWCRDCTEHQRPYFPEFVRRLNVSGIEVLELNVQEEREGFISEANKEILSNFQERRYPRTVLVVDGKISDSENIEVIEPEELNSLASRFIEIGKTAKNNNSSSQLDLTILGSLGNETEQEAYNSSCLKLNDDSLVKIISEQTALNLVSMEGVGFKDVMRIELALSSLDRDRKLKALDVSNITDDLANLTLSDVGASRLVIDYFENMAILNVLERIQNCEDHPGDIFVNDLYLSETLTPQEKLDIGTETYFILSTLGFSSHAELYSLYILSEKRLNSGDMTSSIGSFLKSLNPINFKENVELDPKILLELSELSLDSSEETLNPDVIPLDQEDDPNIDLYLSNFDFDRRDAQWFEEELEIRNVSSERRDNSPEKLTSLDLSSQNPDVDFLMDSYLLDLYSGESNVAQAPKSESLLVKLRRGLTKLASSFFRKN